MPNAKKKTYIEPSDYIPKELRKKYGLGEFNKDVDKKPAKKTAKKTTKKK